MAHSAATIATPTPPMTTSSVVDIALASFAGPVPG
jgi:hypothetical protein